MIEKILKEVKQLIRSILLSNPEGLTFRQLDAEYNILCGEKLPHRELGYASILEFIKDIPDVVAIHARPGHEVILKGAEDESNKDYQSDYPEINKGALSLGIPSCGINNKLVIPEILKNQIMILLKGYKYSILIDEIENAFLNKFGKDLRSLYKSLGFSTLEEFLKQINDIKLTYSACLSKKCFVTILDSSVRKSKNLKESNQILQGAILDILKEEFRRMLYYYPEGIRASQFLEEFNKVSRRNLSLTELGYQNARELALAYPDIFDIRSLDNCEDDILLFSLNNFKNSENLKPASERGSEDDVARNESEKNDEKYERMKNNVKDILRTFSRSIFLQEFEILYKFRYQSELPWKSLGYENVEMFLRDLSTEVPFKIFNIENNLYMSPETQETQHLVGFSDTKYSILPSDSVIPGTPYVVQELPEDLSKYISVYVSEIENPERIWLQIKNDSEQPLDTIMKELEMTYRTEKKKNLRYKMPNSFITVGTICAAIWPVDNNWYRGIITDILQEDQVEIFYADYGTHSTISKSSLMILKKEFLALPFQARKARLANIKPINGTKWDRTSQLRLHQLCINKHLLALITDTKFRERLSVCLCDISKEGYLHINETLIKEGLAEFSDDHQNISLEFANRLRTVCLNQHIKPIIKHYEALQRLTIDGNLLNCVESRNSFQQLIASGINNIRRLEFLFHPNKNSSTVVWSNGLNDENMSIESNEESLNKIFEEQCQVNEYIEIQDSEIFFKRISLNGNKEICIISFNQKYYISNKDLILIFQKYIDLENELMARKLLIPQIVIRKTNNEQLFEILNNICGKEIKYTSDYLVLYPLEYLSKIFSGLGHLFPKEIKKKIDMLCLSYQTKSLEEIRENIQKEYNEKHKILKQMTENQNRDDYIKNLKNIDENLKLLWSRMKELKDEKEEIMDLAENSPKPLTKLVSKITQCYKKH